MTDDRTMSDAEGLMWRLEKDPFLSSTFGTVSILDRPPDFDRLRARMERAALAVPRLGWRVQPSPGDVAPPTWVEDPHFDIDVHVRRIAVAKPGRVRDLLDLAALLIADPLDRTRPLWQFWVVEGVRGGRAALVQKMHHTITDGEGGIEMASQFLDVERDAPDLAPLAPPAAPAPPPAPTDLVRDLVTAGLRLPRAMARQARGWLVDPASITEQGVAAVEAGRELLGQLGDTERAASPLWTARSRRAHIEVARAPFRATLDAARRLGGTLNTAFLTAAADAAGRYHDELGAPVESLRASMAVSTRTARSGANAFSLARLVVPTAKMPIAERFALIHEASLDAGEQARRGSLSALAAVTSSLPTSVLTRIARQQAQTIDFATSNVKGAPVPVYIAGAQLLENYPIGPRAGVAFNLTLLSYDGRLDLGINVDPAAVERPDRLATLIDRSMARLADA